MEEILPFSDIDLHEPGERTRNDADSKSELCRVDSKVSVSVLSRLPVRVAALCTANGAPLRGYLGVYDQQQLVPAKREFTGQTSNEARPVVG